MFSVVIPTMWRFIPFFAHGHNGSFLSDLSSLYLIDEIIIIDNDWKNNPFIDREIYPEWDQWSSPAFPKVRVIPQKENIFVNPAWNLGVSESKNNYICILNDDLVFDTRVFRRVYNFYRGKMHHDLKSESNIGGIFLAPGDFPQTNQPSITNGMIDVIPKKPDMWLWGMGMMMFVEKRKWEPIPEELKMYYGDNWIIEGNEIRGRDNYVISNMFMHTPYSVTSHEIINDSTDTIAFTEKDRDIYSKINSERRKRLHV